MKFLKALCFAAFGVATFGVTSCGCCIGKAPAQSLHPLPQLQSFDAVVVDDAK